MKPLWLVILLAAVQAHPPDMVQPSHIIKTRSIDLNNAYSLTMETPLVKSVKPTNYVLKIQPDLNNNTFNGTVQIDLTWLQYTNEISLHCGPELNVTIDYLKIHTQADDLKNINITKTSYDVRKSVLIIRIEEPIAEGVQGHLHMTFNGTLNTETSEGYFKVTFIDLDDLEKSVAATNLRPNNARRMFPCFDEPRYKATFDVTVYRPHDVMSLGNLDFRRSQSVRENVGLVEEWLRITPPLPPYGLGIVTGAISSAQKPLKYKDEYGNDLQFELLGRQEFLLNMGEVLKKVVRTFKEITDYWQEPLSGLARFSIIALPNYRGAKPADQWGMITFRESDIANKGYLLLAQELSYQWLGLLASPASWTDAHINKALVGYLAAEVTFKINNGTEMEGKWPMTVLYSLYYEYSKRYPHSKITGMKQETACTKMELLFRMFNYTLGGETFKKAMRTFIKKYKFITFTGNDIWDALTNAAHEDGKLPEDMDTKTIALSWINKERLPVVTAIRNYPAKSVLITQKLYLRERPHDVPNAGQLTWWTPLVIARSDNLTFTDTSPSAWIKNHKDINLLNMPCEENFIIINPEEIGPFPVNYDEKNWNLISRFLQSKNRTQIPELTRAKLLHDAWNLAYAGDLSFATALNMTLFLKNEKHHLVWDPVFTMIDHIGRHISEALQTKFQAYVRILLSPLYEELTKDEKEDEDSWRRNLRSLTKTFLCKVGYEPCLKEAQEQYSLWMNLEDPYEGISMYNQYICSVFQWGTMEEWEFGLQRVINFPATRKPSERTYLLKTLAGCPMDPDKIQRLLNVTIVQANGNFTDNDLFLIFSMLTGTPQGYTTLFKFLVNNWDILHRRYLEKPKLWDSLVNSATSQFTTQEGLDLVARLRRNRLGTFQSAAHIIEKNLRTIKEEAKWSAVNLPVIEMWLDSFLQQNDVK